MLPQASDHDEQHSAGLPLHTQLAIESGPQRRICGRVGALPEWRLKRVREHVDSHISEAVNLYQLAEVAGLSRMHFAAQFRAATGLRPHDYVLERRIECAKSMLTGVQSSLAEVALAAGFQGQSHFTTVFKRITGVTPAVWRRLQVGPSDIAPPAAYNTKRKLHAAFLSSNLARQPNSD